jgi:RNA polymerase sigma factor (TIGR02999 family)
MYPRLDMQPELPPHSGMAEDPHEPDTSTPCSPEAPEALLPLVYAELRRLASHRMAHERPGLTLQATALVHEAWLRLGREGKNRWESRAQFFAAAAEAMRRILIDQARRRMTAKRGGRALHRSPLDSDLPTTVPDEQLLAVHDALDTLADEDPAAAALVKLRFFTGMTMAEAAAALDLSHRSAERLWTFARARLRSHMNREI